MIKLKSNRERRSTKERFEIMSLMTNGKTFAIDGALTWEFSRCRARLLRLRRTKLYLPANLKVLLTRYGKKELLKSSSSVLDRLRRTEDQEVRQIVKLLDQYGVGLEQEALLLGED